jgi:hypothetical protein
MAIVLPITSLFLGLHSLFFAVVSFRMAIYRGNNMKKTNYEQTSEFKHRNAVRLSCPGASRRLSRATSSDGDEAECDICSISCRGSRQPDKRCFCTYPN